MSAVRALSARYIFAERLFAEIMRAHIHVHYRVLTSERCEVFDITYLGVCNQCHSRF